MKKLGMALMLAAILALAVAGSAAARHGSGNGSSATASHGDDHGSGGASDDNGGQREPGEDVRGNCDESEHASDAACLAAVTRTSPAATQPGSSSGSGSAASSVTAGRNLVANVGPGFSITLESSAGAAVKTLRAGTYTIVVHDRSPEHNFHLTGRGLDKATSVTSVATTTWRVRVAQGTYRFQCDPHAEMMRGSLRVV
jgi:plastocyanin